MDSQWHHNYELQLSPVKYLKIGEDEKLPAANKSEVQIVTLIRDGGEALVQNTVKPDNEKLITRMEQKFRFSPEGGNLREVSTNKDKILSIKAPPQNTVAQS